MNQFEQLDLVHDFKPSLELVDGLVTDLYVVHHKPQHSETPWLVPSAIKLDPNNNYQPDPNLMPHTKIRELSDGWILTTIQRVVGTKAGEKSYHALTHAKRYQKQGDNLFLEHFEFKSDRWRPNDFSRPDQDGVYTRELFEFLHKSVIISRNDALVRYRKMHDAPANITGFTKLLLNGSRQMRRKERRILGYAPDLNT